MNNGPPPGHTDPDLKVVKEENNHENLWDPGGPLHWIACHQTALSVRGCEGEPIARTSQAE